MNPEIHQLLTREEGQLFDRKSSKIDTKSIANAILGFSNADGGELVIGVTDDKNLEGFKLFPGKNEEIKSFIPNWVLPPIKYTCKEIAFVSNTGEIDCVLVFNIEASPIVHENGRGEVYLRRGKETKLLTYHERQILEQDKGLQRFESKLTNLTIEDMEESSIIEFGKKIGVSSLDPKNILMARDLGEIKDEKFFINYAGVLLFGKKPQKIIERARIRILRFEGTTERTGENLNLVKDQSIEGSVLFQINEVEKILNSFFRDFTKLDTETGRFKTVPEYPPFAWFEILVNAVTHREYSLFGADIQIKIFDDHLEILSPGNFPSTVKENNIKDIHFSRNPKIARVMCDVGYVREMGEGVNRVFEEMKVAGLPEPIFKGIDGAVIVKLFNNASTRILRKERDLEEKINENIYKQLNDKEKRVVLYCLENKTITTSECVSIIKQSDDSALNLLKKLKNYTPAILIDNRKFPNDPKAYYNLNPDIITDNKKNLVVSSSKETELGLDQNKSGQGTLL